MSTGPENNEFVNRQGETEPLIRCFNVIDV